MTDAPVRAVLLAGPTASGKSEIALAVARNFDGVIVNADAMQVYREWRVLTARPDEAVLEAAPHRLFGHVSVLDPYSAGTWLGEVGGEIRTAREAGRLPIVTGGTGLYFDALTRGLAPIPAVSPQTRAEIGRQIALDGLPAAAARLVRCDPATGKMLDLRNPRRVARALELLAETGTGLAEWHARTPEPLLPVAETVAAVLLPPRDMLVQRIDARFDAMMAGGAIDEAKCLLEGGADPDLPGMRPVGARNIFDLLAGKQSFADTVREGKRETRRYAKRQATWYRNRMRSWMMIEAPETDAAIGMIEENLQARCRAA